MSYDPYFKADVCRQCGAMEKVSTIELTAKKIINSRFTYGKRIAMMK
jgi:hypothetical protein